jgi:nicotinamidase-related amidase
VSETALLVMDVQPSTIQRYGSDVVGPVRSAIAGARAAAVPVVYVVVGFRPGFPEISPANKTFARLRHLTEPVVGTVDPSLGARPDEVVVTKKRIGAFAGSDLGVVLRSLGAHTLVLCGISTSGVVLTTLRHAADLDYRLVVLSDACADRDPEVHRVLLEKVFPAQAEVLTAAEWVASLRPARGEEAS